MNTKLRIILFIVNFATLIFGGVLFMVVGYVVNDGLIFYDGLIIAICNIGSIALNIYEYHKKEN